MNILLIGSGGREHALAWKIHQSKHCSSLYIAPGNGGTHLHGINISIDIIDFDAMRQCIIQYKIDMVVIGPEGPLVDGLYDYITKDVSLQHIIVVGPSAKAAQLEGSKAFSKKFMQRYNIPTAAYREFTQENVELAKHYLATHNLPIVLKADGLAAGKGVIICESKTEAENALEKMIMHRQFGTASDKVVVEEFLKGTEASVFVITDGRHYKIIGHAKDYKRVGEGDTGSNTGGMGCVSPVPFVDGAFIQKVISRIIEPTIKGLQHEALPYKGFIFFGLMNVNGDPYLIEYNCRMGDPETEVVLPRLKNDIVELFLHMHNSTLQDVTIEHNEQAAVTVMAVSSGYPGDYRKNIPIHLTKEIENNKNILIFHAGTKMNEKNELLTNGGRVIAVTALRDTITDAAQAAKQAMHDIQFEGKYYRADIGYEFY